MKPKRNLYDELKEGFSALESERGGTLTLKKIHIEDLAAPTIEPGEPGVETQQTQYARRALDQTGRKIP